MSTEIYEEEYGNFGKCLVMRNDKVTVRITVDVGPRIIYYALNGCKNVLNEDTERSTYRSSDELHRFFGTDENWYIYGGHRLWSSPESFPESYTPDNSPVKYEISADTVTLTPAPRTKVGEQHTMRVTLSGNDGSLTVYHSIENIYDKPIKLSPWCMTVGEKGGTLIVPQSRVQTGLLSNRRLVIWEYTDIRDERLYVSNRYLTLRQTGKQEKFKIGMNNTDGWCAYVTDGQIFRKSFGYAEGAEYPDGGCNFETFTDPHIIEIETLGELKTLAPHEKNEAVEQWSLIPCGCGFDPQNDASIEDFVKRYDLDK